MPTLRVRNDAELRDAIARSSNGGTIELQAGAYSGQTFNQIDDDFSAANPLRFVGLSGAAVVEGTVTISDSSHIAFDGLTFQTQEDQYTGSDALPQYWQIGRNVALKLSDSENIEITNSTFLGYEIEQDYYVRGTFNNTRFGLGTITDPEKTDANGIEKGLGGLGVTIRTSDNVELTGNSFKGLNDAISFISIPLALGATSHDRSDGTIIAANHFDGLQQDAIRGTDHSNTTVTQNLFENFQPISHFSNEPGAEPKTHPDAIQFWEDNAGYGVTGLTISENLFYQQSGPLQVIFGHQRGQRSATDTPEFNDFSITDNIIYTGGVHGVSLGSVLGSPGTQSEITGNTILWNGSASVPQIRLSGWDTPSSTSAADLADAGYTNTINISGNLMESRVVLRSFETNPEDVLDTLNADITNNGGTAAEITDAHRFVANLYNAIKTGQLDLANLAINPPGKSSTSNAALPDPAEPQQSTPDQADTPASQPSSNTITGTDGGDKLVGTSGNDIILGGAGGDRILAGAGNDVITAGAGNDWFVLGGTGSDTFVFGDGDGGMKVADWQQGIDKIQLTGGLDFQDARLSNIIHAGKTTASLTFDTNNDGRMDHRLLLADTSVQDLTSSDFI